MAPEDDPTDVSCPLPPPPPSWWHLSFNLLVQLAVGVPLELAHGSVRVAAIYLAGVLAGSLGTSVCDITRQVYLVGASGGVYALLTAHIANVPAGKNRYWGKFRSPLSPTGYGGERDSFLKSD